MEKTVKTGRVNLVEVLIGVLFGEAFHTQPAEIVVAFGAGHLVAAINFLKQGGKLSVVSHKRNNYWDANTITQGFYGFSTSYVHKHWNEY